MEDATQPQPRDYAWPKRGSEMHDEEFRDYLVSTLAGVNVKLDSLYGNGKKGRVELLEDKVNKLVIALVILGATTLASSGEKLSSLAVTIAKFFAG